MSRVILILILVSLTTNVYSAERLEEIVVTANKSQQTLRQIPAAISQLDTDKLIRIDHTHINEALQRAAGVWISRGNGQEHLTAIRSPVLTGAGSCGAFLMAQDGISLRAPGFCNVNELFESPSELASRIEVIRGPNSLIYGTNALHGVVNTITPAIESVSRISMEAGSYDYFRTKASIGSENARIDLSGTSDGGYKDESGFDQQKLVIKLNHGSETRKITTTLSYTNLNQETAGFIQGFEAYKDSSAKKDNPNPEAYRDARSFRLYSMIEQDFADGSLSLTPYIRSIDMEFLQHFLPGQAIEENGHDSIGGQALWINNKGNWRIGLEVDLTDGFLKETQPNATTGSAFLVATIPAGKHYDYEVDARLAGLFTAYDWRLSDRLLVTAGLRYQYVNYDYNNLTLDGRTRDDGTPCGFGGCRFNRPSDREDTFNNWSPKLGFVLDWGVNAQLYGSVSQGFRAPQATELYRLQNDQSAADIDSVELDALELGYRADRERLSFDVTLFLMKKDNFIFRDTDRNNVDNGETSHEGIELELDWTISDSWSASLAMTYANHEYDNNPTFSRTPLEGNEIDTAPETLGSASLMWQPEGAWSMELEWVHIGDYYTDPQNQHEYEGHDLLHLRGDWQANEQTRVFYRLMNLTDEDYAERADFGFGSDRYFVGTPRSFFLGVSYDF